MLSICGRRATLRLHARSASLFAGAGAGAGTGSWDGRGQRFGRHRFLSTTSDDKDTKSRTDDEDALVRFKQFVVSRYGAASGAALLATGMSYAAWKVVSKMMAINFTHVGMAGFVVGFGSCAATTFMLYGLYRQTYIRPERAFNTAVSLISSDEAVAKIMGNTIIKPLRGGDVRAYRMRQGQVLRRQGDDAHRVGSPKAGHDISDLLLGLVGAGCGGRQRVQVGPQHRVYVHCRRFADESWCIGDGRRQRGGRGDGDALARDTYEKVCKQ